MSISDPLATALRQTKPFASRESAAYLALLRVASRFEQEISDLLKPHGITPTQYNVLRILRGATPGGLACNAVLDRLLTRDPDITRLLDRLERLGYVTRARDAQDRRVVVTQVTPSGLELLQQLDKPVKALHAGQLGGLGDERLEQLIDILGDLVVAEPQSTGA